MATRLEGKVIGIIGDEHLVGPFGRALIRLLRDASALVVEDGRAGRTAEVLLEPRPEPETMAACGLKRSGPGVLPAIFGVRPDIVIYVLKPTEALEQLKVLARDRGAKEVWISAPSGKTPELEAAQVVAKLAGQPPPMAPEAPALRPVRARV